MAALAGVVSLFSGVAGAGTILGNLTTSNTNSFVYAGGGYTYGMGFQMGSTAYTLSSAELRLTLSAPSSDAPVLELYSGTATTPTGSALATFVNPNFTIGTALTYTFTLSSSVSLAANTDYWLVLKGGAATYLWVAGNPASTPTGPGATTLGGVSGTANHLPTTHSTSVAVYELDGTASGDASIESLTTAVPAPAAFSGGLAVCGVGAMGQLLRRRR